VLAMHLCLLLIFLLHAAVSVEAIKNLSKEFNKVCDRKGQVRQLLLSSFFFALPRTRQAPPPPSLFSSSSSLLPRAGERRALRFAAIVTVK
jgi:hypothetical protein